MRMVAELILDDVVVIKKLRKFITFGLNGTNQATLSLGILGSAKIVAIFQTWHKNTKGQNNNGFKKKI